MENGDSLIRTIFRAIQERFASDNGSGKPDELPKAEIEQLLNVIRNTTHHVYGTLITFSGDQNASLVATTADIDGQASRTVVVVSPEQYLSSVIHRGRDWLPNKIYIFNEDFSSNNVESEIWYQVRKFDDLPKLPDETLDHLFSHFGSNSSGKVCVYCPFIVPDNKPLANFVGFYQGVNNFGKDSDFINHIAEIQHAGTLVFSSQAIRILADGKHIKIAERVTNLSNQFKDVERTMANFTGEINSILVLLEPHMLNPGKQYFAGMKTGLEAEVFKPDHVIGKHTTNQKLYAFITGTGKSDYDGLIQCLGAVKELV